MATRTIHPPVKIGQEFTRLTVLKAADPYVRQYRGFTIKYKRWTCECKCGTIKDFQEALLKKGTTQSCGCLNREISAKQATKHGLSLSPEYLVWGAMIGRVTNPKNKGYKNYGGRGIGIAESWLKFENFYNDMGPRPIGNYSLERRDNNGNYCKESCEWIPRGRQNLNTRSNRLITYEGKTLPMAEWARILGLKYDSLKHKIRKGLSLEEILAHEQQSVVFRPQAD